MLLDTARCVVSFEVIILIIKIPLSLHFSSSAIFDQFPGCRSIQLL